MLLNTALEVNNKWETLVTVKYQATKSNKHILKSLKTLYLSMALNLHF